MLVCFFSVPSFCVVTSEAVSHSHARAFQSGHDQESSCADTPVYALLAVHSSPSVSLRASSTPFSIVYEVEWCGVEWSALVSSGVARWQGVILAILARIRNRGVHVIQLWQRVFSHRFLCALHNLTARNCRGNYF